MIYQDRIRYVKKDEILRKAAVKYADNISANSGEIWVQVWEKAYQQKIKELRAEK